MGGASEEFPLLAAYGVEAVPILGDGSLPFQHRIYLALLQLIDFLRE